MDFFPVTVSPCVQPLLFPDKVESLLASAKVGEVKAFICYQEHKHLRVFHQILEDWTQIQHQLDNFKRCYEASQICNQVRLEKVRWDKISHRLMSNVTAPRKYSDTRLGYLYRNIFLVKANFTFGLRTVEEGTRHVYQTTEAPLLCYVMDPKDTKSCKVRRCFVPHDQFRFQRYVLNPNRRYVIPQGTRYLILCVQKTAFALDIVPNTLEVEGALVCTTHRKYIEPPCYKLPPPTPVHNSFVKPKPIERIVEEPVVVEVFPDAMLPPTRVPSGKTCVVPVVYPTPLSMPVVDSLPPSSLSMPVVDSLPPSSLSMPVVDSLPPSSLSMPVVDSLPPSSLSMPVDTLPPAMSAPILSMPVDTLPPAMSAPILSMPMDTLPVTPSEETLPSDAYLDFSLLDDSQWNSIQDF